jgi:endonuclease YncB( thermonuclease family)
MTARLFCTRNRLLGAMLCGMLFGATAPSLAAGCEFDIQGEGVVSAVVDARTLRLEDGREVRLAGVEIVAGEPEDRKSVLTALIGRHMILRGERDDPDRYGRQSVFLYYPEPSAGSAQHDLLARGEAIASADIVDKACATELAAAEAAARQARRGTWANSSVVKNVQNPADILTRVGQFAVVEGKVVSVRQAGGTVYVNFGRRWTRDFAATISRRVVAYLEAAGIAPSSLENRRVRIRGWVERRGGPRINVLRVGQIELIGD